MFYVSLQVEVMILLLKGHHSVQCQLSGGLRNALSHAPILSGRTSYLRFDSRLSLPQMATAHLPTIHPSTLFLDRLLNSPKYCQSGSFDEF